MNTFNTLSKVPLKKNVNILVIDDDEDDYILTCSQINNMANGFKCTLSWSSNYKHALEEICKATHDVYFVDFRLGEKTGLDLISEAMGNGCEEPMVLLTGVGTQEIDIMAMEAGAVDYLVKSEMTPEKLERCIRYALGRYEFIKALKVNEQKFRNIFERSKDSVFIADNAVHFKDVNEATSTIFGYSKKELLQLTLYDLVIDESDKKMIRQLMETKQEVTDMETILCTKDKEKINCILSMTVEKDDLEETYIQGILHDITTLKNAEKATLQAEKSRAAERLIRTLAHEVRNPLNNINLSVEQLASEIDDEDSNSFIDIIKRNSNRINSLISELLNSSKPTDILQEKIILQSVLEPTIANALDRITLKNIQLEKNYLQEDAWLYGDAEKLQIAFLNIIINAVEAMPENTGVLRIKLFSEDGKYIIHFQDNGSGISDEGMNKLFEPYFTTKRNGMGLGLASTLNIIQSHKGFIDVKSSHQRGTLFIISFKKVGE